MIDLKLNELPIDALGDFSEDQFLQLTPEQQEAVRQHRRAAGLSIFETAAAGPTMSVGARGTDTSGVKTGAGAGAGSMISTPASSDDSTVPDIVEGARKTGTVI